MSKNSSFVRKTGFLCVLTLLMGAGCDLGTNYLKTDRGSGFDVQDYRDALAPRLPEIKEDASLDGSPDGPGGERGAYAGVPGLQDYIAGPDEALKAMPLVSISVNQTIPLRDVLFELAEQAEYDIELDPRIQGSIIFTARNRPLDVVVDRISTVAGLRYKFEDEILRVELDTPYHKIYKINYLSYIRSNQSSVRNDVAVVSGSGTSTGSQFQMSSESEADFWGELDANLGQILNGDQNISSLKTQNDPAITAVAETEAPVEPLILDEDGELAEGDVPETPETVLRVDSLPVSDVDTGAGAGGGSGGVVDSRFSINKHSGTVSVFATEKLHEQVEEYLEDLKRTSMAQVLVEVKILEVSLTDEFATGIDWGQLDFLSGELDLSFDSGGAPLPALLLTPDSPGVNFRAGFSGNDFNTLVEAISRFGTIKALSNPRMTVLNNQSAVLGVANNVVYFEIDVDIIDQDNAPSRTEVDSEIRNVPEGVLINVQPSIDLENRTVSMAVRPTITKIDNRVEDPAVGFLNVPGLSSQVPEVNVQEFDSVVQLQSGQAMLMGGLMQDRVESDQESVPVLGELPLLGAAFRNQRDLVRKTELVVFLKATIVDPAGQSIHTTDKDLYRGFSGDRRPMDL